MNRDRTVLHLQLARVLRSISQGIAVVDLALYLKSLHWSGTAIGSVLATAGLVGAVLILLVGVLSDRIGRKPFLLVYECLTVVAAALLTVSTNATLLSIVIVLTGFGRGQNGAAGPFTPAEQAWMAAHVPRSDRGRVFSVNTALGFFGMAAGCLLAGLPRLWSNGLLSPASFRPLFILMCIASAACVVVIATAPSERHRADRASRSPARVEEGRAAAVESAAPQTPTPRGGEVGGPVHDEERVRRQENRNMAKLALVNMLNGLAIGFVGPLMSYWFAAKFGVSAAAVGVTLALSFVFTGVSSVLTGALTQRFGMVRSVVWLQLFGILMMLLLPLARSFWLASVIYIVRSAFSRGTQGARSALSSSLTRDKRRGFSVSMNSLAMRATSAIGPSISGSLYDVGSLSLPFFLTAGLQLCSTLLYGRLFRDFDRD